MKTLLIILFCLAANVAASAQSMIKEAMNSYAMFTNSGNVGDLENARKQIDEAYATRKDSAAYRNNLVRSLIYSTLAFVDSTRKFSYKNDPIAEAQFSLKKLADPKLNEENEQELAHVNKQLSQAYLVQANKQLALENYEEALKAYSKVDSMEVDDVNITYNMAILNEKLGNAEKAIELYEKLLADKPKPEYYMILANLYEADGNDNEMLRILQSGRQKYPEYRDLVFKEINTYIADQNYTAVTTVIADALKFDETDADLNYLAGFSYEMTGDDRKAEQYYTKILEIDPANYEANYALGLLNLQAYLSKKGDQEKMNAARKFLEKANEIKPYEMKLLRSLAILYKNNGDTAELENVNNKLNELLLN